MNLTTMIETTERLGARLDDDLSAEGLLDISTALTLTAGLFEKHLQQSGGRYDRTQMHRAFRAASAVEQVCGGAALLDGPDLETMLHLAQARLARALAELRPATSEPATRSG